MADVKTRFPQDMDYVISLDTTRSVTEGIKDIVVTLLIAIALVTVVVYLFLQGWRATMIPLLAVPVSLIGTFVLFPAFGFSINTLSLFGLVLAIGPVVDDAIGGVEAVERHTSKTALRLGWMPRWKAMEEISGPVVGIALVLLCTNIHSHGVHSRHHGTALSAVRGKRSRFPSSLSAFNAGFLAQPLALAALSCCVRKPRAAARWRNSSVGSIACSATPPINTFACRERSFGKVPSPGMLVVFGIAGAFFVRFVPGQLLAGRRRSAACSCISSCPTPPPSSAPRTPPRKSKRSWPTRPECNTPPPSPVSACSASCGPLTTDSSSSLSRTGMNARAGRSSIRRYCIT